MTYTPEQLREEANTAEADHAAGHPVTVDVDVFVQLARAHAAALEELARVKAPADGEIAEVARKLRDWKQFRTKPMPLAHYFVAGCEAADLLESFAARVLELEPDAKKWRAFVGCARLRAIGWAELDAPTPYAHIGLEAWTIHGADSEPIAIEALEKFVAKCIAIDAARSKP